MKTKIVEETKEKGKKIEVAVRMRPLLYNFQDQPAWLIDKKYKSVASIPRQNILKIANTNESTILKKKISEAINNYNFQFDYVFDHDSTTYQIFQKSCSKIVDGFLQGNNCTIFMYGQTTSGKTYTMLGDQNYEGIITFSLIDIYKKFINMNHKNHKYEIIISYLQIYNEQINDLLNPGSMNLKIQQDSSLGVFVQGLRQCKAESFQQAQQLLMIGQEQRAYKEKNIHDHSSRSHTIFQIKIHEIGENRTKCQLNLVDLAGSERLQDEQKANEIPQQTGYINKSLFVLSNVINKLAKGKKNTHIPFRDSKLTRLLSNSLNGNSSTMIICTLSPAAMNFYQTLSTLRFATNAKKVETKPICVQTQEGNQKQNIKECLIKKNRQFENLKVENLKLKKMIEQSTKNQIVLKSKLEEIREQSLQLTKKSTSVKQQKSQLLWGIKERIEDIVDYRIAKQNKQWNEKSRNLYEQYEKNIEILQNKYKIALFNIAENSFPNQRFEINLYQKGKTASEIFNKIKSKEIFNDIIISSVLNSQYDEQITLEQLKQAHCQAKKSLLQKYIELKRFLMKKKQNTLLSMVQKMFSEKMEIIDKAFREVQKTKIY